MPDAPTPLDLDAIRDDLDASDRDLKKWVRLPVKHVRAALAEIERLRAEVARPAPAWDEEAVLVALVDAHLASVRQVMEDGYPSIFVRSNEDAADAALAVVREHLPVKPSREEVARAISPDSWLDVDYGPAPSGTGEQAWDLIKARVTGSARAASLAAASRALDLLPGRSEAEVKAEALREAERAANHDWLAFQSVWGSSPLDLAVLAFANKALDWLRDRADRLAADRGVDRGWGARRR